MKKLIFLSLILLTSLSIQATTVYYNGEENDIGAWFIQEGGTDNASITEVYDDTLNGTVMQFTDGGVYQLLMPDGSTLDNETEKIISFDMRLNSYYTIYIYVDTLFGTRKLFYNAINVHVGHHNTGILNAIGNSRTYGGHPNSREGWVRATLDLDRELTDTEPENRVTRVLSMEIAGTSGRVDNVTLSNPSRVTHSNNALDWRITEGVTEGGTIEDFYESEDRGNVISFSGTDESNSYSTGATSGDGAWNDTTHDIIQWKMKTATNYKFIVHITTANGERDLIYVTDIADSDYNPSTEEIGVGIGWSRDGDGAEYGDGTDGRWQTMTRNLATDVSEFETGNSLIAVNGVTVIGVDGRTTSANMIASEILFDDLQLFSSVVPTLATGEATELHAWNLGETSVSISFIDHSEGEAGFRYINTDTGVQLGADLPAKSGTEASTIGAITGLTQNTTYHISVETFFNDGRASTNSEPLELTTDEDPNAGAEEATDLHRWALTENSVKISFIDNATGEIGFRYINADTGTQLGTDLSPIDGTGTAGIGQITGLTPNTTYNILVHTLFDDGRATAVSQPISITTLEEPTIESEPADDLHTWALTSTSVNISFKDNAEGETGFRYINTDSGEIVGEALPSTEGTGTASIGSITGLIAETTYHIAVETLFDDGRENLLSEAIEFTTLAP